MNIAIIGAGFTGLSSAYQLLKKGYDVTVFEKDSTAGGLAVGFKDKTWKWSLEKHYHHWFTNDKYALNLAKEINCNTLIKRPKTSVFVKNSIFQMDSISSILSFPHLSLVDKLRMAFVLGIIRYNPFWKPLEKIKANQFLPFIMGRNAYETIWKPQFHNKFGTYIQDISMAWFWARIVKRTSSLAYPEKGFLNFADKLVEKIKQNGGKVLFDTQIKEIRYKNGAQIKLTDNNGKSEIRNYDKVIVTLPSFAFTTIAPDLPSEYVKRSMKLKGLGAINLVLRLRNQFLKDDTYWLSICDKAPVMAIVEHTNFMDKKYYNNEHIVYLGNYLPHDHPYMKMSASELLKIYDPFLKKINPNYRLSVISYQLFSVPFAQPIIPINYSKMIPPSETPIKNVYLANIQQVYPWDRGTNYAIELGEKAAKLITNS